MSTHYTPVLVPSEHADDVRAYVYLLEEWDRYEAETERARARAGEPDSGRESEPEPERSERTLPVE